MKDHKQMTDYDKILGYLEKRARDCGLMLYQFKAAQYNVLEVRKKESDKYNCIGFYTVGENVKNPKFYHRKISKDIIGDHLFRIHGPDHPYGRGSDKYHENLSGYNQNSETEKRIWRDLKLKSETLEDTLKILENIIEDKLLLKKREKTRVDSSYEMQ